LRTGLGFLTGIASSAMPASGRSIRPSGWLHWVRCLQVSHMGWGIGTKAKGLVNSLGKQLHYNPCFMFREPFPLLLFANDD
jgi:hypothetical protein